MRALAFALSFALLCPTLVRAQDDEPVTVDEAGLVSTTLVDVPLAEALLQLAEAADVSLVLPATTLEWVDLRVTARLRSVPLPAAFDLLLKVCGVKGRLETAGDTKVLLVDLSPQEALALAQLELSHAEVVAHRAELQARLAERELDLRRLQDEEEEDEDGEDDEDDVDDEMNEDGHQHHGPVHGDDGEWEEEEEETERDEDEGHRGEQRDEDEDSSMAPAPDREIDQAEVERAIARGQARARDGDEGAIEDFDEALRLDPDSAAALVSKAALLIARQELEAARACLERALAIDPANAEAYFQRGVLHLKARPRQYQLALDDLSRVIALDPAHRDAYFYRALAFHDQKRWDDCLADLERSLLPGEGGARLRDVTLVRGHTHYQRREWEAARQAYDEYLQLALPGSLVIPKVKTRLAEVRAALGE
jgi:tetratricopeptide (TPR) repeat protein